MITVKAVSEISTAQALALKSMAPYLRDATPLINALGLMAERAANQSMVGETDPIRRSCLVFERVQHALQLNVHTFAVQYDELLRKRIPKIPETDEPMISLIKPDHRSLSVEPDALQRFVDTFRNIIAERLALLELDLGLWEIAFAEAKSAPTSLQQPGVISFPDVKDRILAVAHCEKYGTNSSLERARVDMDSHDERSHLHTNIDEKFFHTRWMQLIAFLATGQGFIDRSDNEYLTDHIYSSLRRLGNDAVLETLFGEYNRGIVALREAHQLNKDFPMVPRDNLCGDLAEVVTAQGKVVISRPQLKTLCQVLADSPFLRAHLETSFAVGTLLNA